MSKKPRKKKPYFPNNIEAYQQAPSEWFDGIPFKDFMEWRVHGWELPSSVACIIRERNLKTGKVKEYIYQRADAAKKRSDKIMAEGVSEFTVATTDAVHHLYPDELEAWDDKLY